MIRLTRIWSFPFGIVPLALAMTASHAEDLITYNPLHVGDTSTSVVLTTDLDTDEPTTEIGFASSAVGPQDLVNGFLAYRVGKPGSLNPDAEASGSISATVANFKNHVWTEDALVIVRDYEKLDENFAAQIGEENLIIEEIYDPPLLLLPRHFNVGDTMTSTWTKDWSIDEYPEAYTFLTDKYTHEGREIVTVPAGTFDCVRIRIDRTTDLYLSGGQIYGSSQSRIYAWLAEGVGDVKSLEEYELQRIERYLAFAVVNGTLIGSQPALDNAERVYIAYYGRPGDPAGSLYWSSRLTYEGNSLDAIIDQFANSEEAVERFAGMDSAQLIETLYQQMFGRSPDSAGLDYYTNLLETSATTLQRIMLDVLFGAQGDDALIIANKLEVAEYFTLRVQTLGKSYLSGDIEAAREVLEMVTADASSVGAAKALADSVIDGMAAAY